MRRRDIALAICGTVMALSSIAVIASNSAEDRPGGLAVLLFAAAILSVPISGRLAKRNRLLPRLDRIEHDGALQPALVLPGSLVKLRLMRIGCLCFAGAGVVMAVWPLESSGHSVGEVRLVGIGCAALFGAIGLAGTLLARGRSGSSCCRTPCAGKSAPGRVPSRGRTSLACGSLRFAAPGFSQST